MRTVAIVLRGARVLVPCVFAAGVCLFLIFVWPDVVGSQGGRTRYWFARAEPGLMLATPALLSLGFVAVLPLHLRRSVTMAALFVIMCLAANYAIGEYHRLAPFVGSGGMSWRHVLRFADASLIGGAILAMACCAAAGRLSLNRGPNLRRSRIAALGNADWMPIHDARRLLPPSGGLVIGEAYRVDRDIVAGLAFDPYDEATWGQGGKAPLLTYPFSGPGHALVIAGSGGFKTASVVLTTAATYPGPMVVLDPPCEISQMVAAHRSDVFRRDVVILDPRKGHAGFNVLDWILTSPTPEQHIATVAHWLLTDSARVATDTGTYFQNQAHNFLTGCLAYVMLSPEFANRRNLRSLRAMIADPEPVIRQKLQEIHETFDNSFVRETLGVFINMTEATFSGVYSTASKDTQWLSFPEYADLVCGGSFKSSDIASGALDTFVNLRTEVLQVYPGIARVIIGALINAMMQADGRHAARVLFLLDEANLLGYMRTLETARDVGRKYGISLALLYQSIGQLRKHFGPEGKEAWFDGVGLIAFAAIGDISAAKEISALCGEITVEVRSRSRPLGLAADKESTRRTETIGHQRRPLIMPHEVIQSMRADEQIVVVKGRAPLRCGRAIFFRRPELRRRMAKSRFVRTPAKDMQAGGRLLQSILGGLCRTR